MPEAAAAEPRPVVSVVIPVHNDPAGLRDTLEALERQTLPRGDFEVLVVDDGSTDDTAAVGSSFSVATVVGRPRSGGSYVARNDGLRAASGRILAFTDADCVPDPDWLERAVGRLTRDPAQVLGGRIQMPLGPRPTIAAMVDVVHHLDQRRSVESEGFAVTANVVTTREVFDAVGTFDERLRSGGDREWTSRAKRAGFALVYADDVRITHAPRTSGRELARKSRRVGRGSSARRHSEPVPRRRAHYLQSGWLRPWHREAGLARVRENGANPTALQWALVGLGQLAFVQYSQVAGAMAQDLRFALRGARGARRRVRRRGA